MAGTHRVDNQAKRKSGRTQGRHRAAPTSRLQPYAWLGAGALTLGIGAAALSSGAGVAHADEGASDIGNSTTSSTADASTSGNATSAVTHTRATTAKPKKKPRVGGTAASDVSASTSATDASESASSTVSAEDKKKPARSAHVAASRSTSKAVAAANNESVDANSADSAPNIQTTPDTSIATAKFASSKSADSLAPVALAVTAASTPAAGARHVSTGGEVFLGGNFIQLGVSQVGSLGTVGSAPSDFFGSGSPGTYGSGIGFGYEADGYGGSAPKLDFSVPDSPEERWSIGYNDTSYGGFSQLNGNGGTAATLTNSSVTDKSSGNSLSATSQTTVNNTLRVEQVYTFKVSDTIYKTTVTLRNVSSDTLTDVEYMRSIDPDNTRAYSGSNSTINTVAAQYGTDKYSLVTATSLPGDQYDTLTGNQVTLFYYSPEAKASVYTAGFSNSNPYNFSAVAQPKGSANTSDTAIGIVFNIGKLTAGSSATFSYYTGATDADPATIKALVDKVRSSGGSGADLGSFLNSAFAGVRSTFSNLFNFANDVGSRIGSAVSYSLNGTRVTLASASISTGDALSSLYHGGIFGFLDYINVKNQVHGVATSGNVPDSTGGLYSELRTITKDDYDGIVVQKIKAPDGDRFIVFLGGTDPLSTTNQPLVKNLPAYQGTVSLHQINVIQAALGNQKNAKIMLVGYSQGGLDAQNIAANRSTYGLNVTTVITFGTPVTRGPSSNYRIGYIQDAQDPVTKTFNVATWVTKNAANIFTGQSSSDFDLTPEQLLLNPFYVHGTEKTYVELGNRFDAQNYAVEEYIDKFTGPKKYVYGKSTRSSG